ncbi:cytochrome c oxidase subunit 3 [Microvirga sp. 17 mud 1-3]|uniref:cytochrome c oxidase subunit 3 n=1 Tax=Microvirga sp. 17 mud 1-3 TaxID=2082949 RepID=UPI001AEC841E|nr:cytochrome c oxidase subunit 3 [Microvirga sp. 17 mud 1-3]
MSDQPAAHSPYAEPAQQREADLLGMYIFLVTEIMLFGGFLTAVYVVRVLHPEEASSAAKHLNLWLGSLNTAVLLTSSLAMALAVQLSREGKFRATSAWLCLTVALGLVFLAIKSVEYYQEYAEGLMPLSDGMRPLSKPGEQLFFNFYLVGTGLHALHLTIGIILVSGLAWRVARSETPLPRRAVTVEIVGLYWHLVDVVWVFIYPIFYLAR